MSEAPAIRDIPDFVRNSVNLASAGLGAKALFAINKDAEAPLMKIADVALVGDLFEAVPAVIAELDKLGLKR